MKEYPILYSTPMVLSVLANIKDQTRRTLRDPEHIRHLDILLKKADPSNLHDLIRRSITDVGSPFKSQFGSEGDIYWVREEHKVWFEGDRCIVEFKDGLRFSHYYKSLSLNTLIKLKERKTLGKWQRARFLPKDLSRIWLRSNGVRIEKLQAISETDAIHEGIESWNDDFHSEPGAMHADFKNYLWRDDPAYEDYYFPSFPSAVDSYRSLWIKINGAGTWEANPWVWVVEFDILSKTGRPVL